MRTNYEVADVINKFYDEVFRVRIPIHHQRTLQALQSCRTAALGGHAQACDSCGQVKVSYNSCRNRHCPKCQGLQKEMWIIQREEELLPLAYFHVVFTLPHQLNGLCLHNPRFMYDLLFESTWYVLDKFGRNKQWLGAQTAATMILHTWGQNLQLHPHLHCIVPNGGINKNGDWQNPKKGNSKFIYPILAMNKVFKAYFLKRLRQHLEHGELALPKHFPCHSNYYNWKEKLYKMDWVVYCKPPFGGAQNVVQYLARYSHRIAITNRRIINITDEKVSFRYKDYKQNASSKVMALKGAAFLQRFCLHILPPRFRKIRHYGFLSNAAKKSGLEQAKKALLKKKHYALSRIERKALALQRLHGQNRDTCPCCKEGKMVIIEILAPNKDPPFCKPNKKI